MSLQDSTGAQGDLFSQEGVTEEFPVFTVESLNKELGSLIEGQFRQIWLRAEISNFKAHSSGHFYFSLKDNKSQIRAVMFRGANSRLKFKPHDGLEVLIKGSVTVYQPRGEYQILCSSMEPVGAGALQKAFEDLKKKLMAEGLFAAEKKRPLPKLPQRIAIVTSPTGAAIRDMIHVLTRRSPSVEVFLVPTVVQGEAASPKIMEAFTQALRIPQVEVIIVGRGGGSIEDLWAFNDEALARMIAESPVPVISAVGHEVDFTIADFVADVRAPTPSAAAEIVAQSSEELMERIRLTKTALWRNWRALMQARKDRLNSLQHRLVDPQRRIQDLFMRQDELSTRLSAATLRFLVERQKHLIYLRQKLGTPQEKLRSLEQKRAYLAKQLDARIQRGVERAQDRLNRSMSVLDSLSPLRVVERGFAVIFDKDRQLIRSHHQVRSGDDLVLHLAEGKIEAKVIHSEDEKEKSWISKRS